MYLIWSYEHNAWWRFASRGYTTKVMDAGLYTEEQATEICRSANEFCDPDNPNEVMKKAEEHGR